MKIKIFAMLLITVFAVHALNANNTPGTVTFKVTTATASGEHAPKHVLAIWIKNSSGQFVRSMKVMALQRIQYLYKWKQSSVLNTTNAITGSTLTTHATHTISWNCTDNSGNVLPDGEYQFWVEFTESEGQGPYTSFSFTKGTSSANLTFGNSTNFKNVSIVYTPDNSDVETLPQLEARVIHSPNSSLTLFQIPSVEADNAQLQVYDLSGRKVFETQKFIDNGQVRTFQWMTKDADRAKFFVYRIENGSDTYKGKLYKSGR